MKCQCIVPAAGLGDRLGRSQPKALVEVCGKPLLLRTLEALEAAGIGHDAIVTFPEGYEGAFGEAIHAVFPDVRLVQGGATRQASVSFALAELAPTTTHVAIHDAARPFVTRAVIREGLEAADEYGAATVALPCADTILEVDDKGFLIETPDRSGMWACQTPQVFEVGIIRQAHAAAASEGRHFTDDASLVRSLGRPVKIAMGSRENLKITVAEDLRIAEALLKARNACTELV